jgi:hypothetical protein
VYEINSSSGQLTALTSSEIYPLSLSGGQVSTPLAIRFGHRLEIARGTCLPHWGRGAIWSSRSHRIPRPARRHTLSGAVLPICRRGRPRSATMRWR